MKFNYIHERIFFSALRSIVSEDQCTQLLSQDLNQLKRRMELEGGGDD